MLDWQFSKSAGDQLISRKTYTFKHIVAIFIVTMFFSCTDNIKEVQKIGVSENEPVGIAEDINLKYTDSGRVTANLLASKMLDYSNRDFPYNEFVNGLTLYLFDKDDNKSKVVSDYAIVYNKTDLVDLQGNVVITTYDGKILKTEQLYYDQSKEWLFTNYPVEFTTDRDKINGNGFDSDSKFANAQVLEVTGLITIED